MESALSHVTEALFHPCPLLRHAVLRALVSLPVSTLPSDPQLLVGLLIAQQDDEEANRTMADRCLFNIHLDHS